MQQKKNYLIKHKTNNKKDNIMGRNYQTNLRRFIAEEVIQSAAYHDVGHVLSRLKKMASEYGAEVMLKELDSILALEHIQKNVDIENSKRLRIDFCNALEDQIGQYNAGPFLNLLMSAHGYMSDDEDHVEMWHQEASKKRRI